MDIESPSHVAPYGHRGPGCYTRWRPKGFFFWRREGASAKEGNLLRGQEVHDLTQPALRSGNCLPPTHGLVFFETLRISI